MRILVRLGHLYHLASLGPVADEFIRRGHEVEFSCEHESKRVLGIPIKKKRTAEDKLRNMGYKIADQKSGLDIVLTGDVLPDPDIYAPAGFILVFHGKGFKNLVYRNLKRWPEIEYQIMVEGPHRKKRMEETGARGISQVHVVGYPKLDPLFSGKVDISPIIDKYDLNPELPTVLFAPSHKPSCIDIIGDSICAATEDMNLLIKLHPFSWGGKYAPHRHHRLYERAIKGFDHARLVSPEDRNIIPFIAASDIIVSGVSSTIYEMFAAGKFGVIVEVPNRLRRDSNPELDIEPAKLFEGVWPIVKNPKNLKDAILEALSPEETVCARAAALRKELFFGLDGKASSRIVDIAEGCFKDKQKTS